MRVGVCGTGRAGKEMIKRILKDDEHTLSLVINRSSSKDVGIDVGKLVDGERMNLPVMSIDEAISNSAIDKTDVIIDFSGKETSVYLAECLAGKQINLVTCTTNYSDELWSDYIKAVARINGAVVYASTLTLGINLLIEYVSKLSKILKDFDFEIVERHRVGKPRPTTTAEKIANSIDREHVHISSVRAGGYVGIHEVTAASERERITIVHESFSREAFVYGAMLAAEFAEGKKGFFEMKDVVRDIERKALDE